MKEVKPGTVVTVEVNLDALDPATAIPIPSDYLGGVPVTMAGVTSKLAIKIRRRNLKGGGNQNNASWRNRHGGAWVNPVNTRFKGGR